MLDSPSFDVLYEHYRTRLYWRAYALLGKHEDAEDAVQQAFLNVWQARARERLMKGNVYGLLYIAVTNIARDLLRHRRVCARREAFSFDVVEEGYVERAESVMVPFDEAYAEREAIRYALHRVAPEQLVLFLASLEMSLQEIATVQGRSLWTLRRALKHTRHRLQEAYEAVSSA